MTFCSNSPHAIVRFTRQRVSGKTIGTFTKAVLAATQAQPAGLVHLVANVAVLTADLEGKVFFNWQYSSDGGKTWIAAPSTPHGKTSLAGLTPLVTYSFRACVTARNVTTPWSQAVTLLVR